MLIADVESVADSRFKWLVKLSMCRLGNQWLRCNPCSVWLVPCSIKETAAKIVPFSSSRPQDESVKRSAAWPRARSHPSTCRLDQTAGLSFERLVTARNGHEIQLVNGLGCRGGFHAAISRRPSMNACCGHDQCRSINIFQFSIE